MTRMTDMTAGKPIRLILRFAVPVMAGNLLQQVYSLADTLIIGRAEGVAALAAVASSGWLEYMVLGCVIELCQGFGIRMSHCFGAGNGKGLKKAAGQSALLALLAAVLFEAVSQGMLHRALRWLTTPEETFGLTRTYLRILYGGIPVVMGYNLLAGALRAVGDSRTPLLAVIAAAVCNIAMDVLLVMGLRWGVTGAALATVFSQGVSFLVCFAAWRRTKALHPGRGELRPDPAEMKKLAGLGLPMALQILVISAGGLILSSVVNTYGYVFMAGYNAPSRLQAIMESVGTALGSGVSTFTGQNHGAARHDRVREGVRGSAWAAVMFSAGMGALMLLAGRQLLSLLMRDERDLVDRVLLIGYRFTSVMSLGLPALYLLFVYRSALQGLGIVSVPFLSSGVELVIRIGSVLALPGLIGEWGLYLAEVLAWAGAWLFLMEEYLRRTRALWRGAALPEDRKEGPRRG